MDLYLQDRCNPGPARSWPRRVALRSRRPSIGREDRAAAISAEAGEPARLTLMTDQLRDADYIARRLGVPKTWVYKAARRGELPSVQCGRYRRFDDRDIDSWIEEQRATEGSSTERSPDD